MKKPTVLVRYKDLQAAQDALRRLNLDPPFNPFYDRHDRLIVEKVWAPGVYSAERFKPSPLAKRDRQRIFAKHY